MCAWARVCVNTIEPYIKCNEHLVAIEEIELVYDVIPFKYSDN